MIISVSIFLTLILNEASPSHQQTITPLISESTPPSPSLSQTTTLLSRTAERLWGNHGVWNAVIFTVKKMAAHDLFCPSMRGIKTGMWRQTAIPLPGIKESLASTLALVHARAPFLISVSRHAVWMALGRMFLRRMADTCCCEKLNKGYAVGVLDATTRGPCRIPSTPLCFPVVNKAATTTSGKASSPQA